MKQKTFFAISILVILTLLLTACNSFGTPATPDPAVLQATINAAVTQTVEAMAVQMTSTALAMPTATVTLEPTATATVEPSATVIIPTATNTRVPYTPVPTKTATPTNYACQLISTSPTAGTKFKTGDEFDAVWKVKNIGVLTWDVGNVDLVYDSGSKLQKIADIYDVSSEVKPGSELSLVVDMVVPSTAGTYKATWKLRIAGTTICTLPVSIEAVNP